jgi:D-alanyl-lipoteichoic acid acyltransferase DltB (MBOAT superfamily)
MQRDLSVKSWDKFLPLVLLLAGTGITAIALAADYLAFGGLPGIGPRQFALALSGIAVLLTGVVLMVSDRWRYIGEYLLVGAAVITVAFAADLLVINGLPELRDKQIVLASIGFSLLATIAIPVLSVDQQKGGQWFNSLSLDRLKISRFLSLVVQLGLLVLVMDQFHLENQAFYQNIMPLIFYGFLIHYFLPLHYRLPFFLLLSLVALGGILGFANSAWLIGIGLCFIGICHLPVSYWTRIAILLVVGILLATLRVGWISAPWLDVIWPILASMFMFRLIIYLYDLKHGKAKPTLTSTLSYFFLLPNVVFPFFPVVDYSTFRRTYYNDEQDQIYQRGMQWMLRGVLQLIIYRYIYYYVATTPEAVTNTTELVRYLISNFALYIRISGQFHLIIGILHLFGFNLPETHHLYFLASSFTDLWRRINIYWKDFMMKVFYFPIYFRIRQWGATTSLVIATLIVFFLTWFFHAYQWFWLRGSFLFTIPDMLFWFILALLVVANTLYEDRRGRTRTLAGQGFQSIGDLVAPTLRSAGTFTVIALLWSLWSSESIQNWLALLSVVEPTLADITLLIATFLVIALVFGLTLWMGTLTTKRAGPPAKQSVSFRSVTVTLGSMLVLLLISNPVVYTQLEDNAQALIKDLTMNRLSDQEAALLQQGYYEDLTGVNRFNSQLWEIYTKRPSDWASIRDTEAIRETNDNLILELVPSTTIDFNGVTLTTNRWGMRDQDYERMPTPGTYRIALTGPSFVMGLGVADHEGFEWLLEERLNREDAGSRYTKYEILNFAVPAYSAIQDLMVLEQKALSFQPNALFFMAHQRDEEAVVGYLADRISVGAELPYPELGALMGRAGIAAGATKEEAERALSPFGTELLAWSYREIVEVSHANNILPVWIFMPTLEDPLQEEEVIYLTRLAEESGFIVLDLSDAYDNQDVESLVVAYWDKHPNAQGHRLIAERLYQALEEKKEEVPLFPSDMD